jgi:hypothetical protein
MSTSLASDMKIYDPAFQTGYSETVAQNLKVLTEKANGAIIVEDVAAPGDYIKNSFFKLPSGGVSRRITSGTGATADATDITVSQGENAEVRLSRRIGPFGITDDALRKIGNSVEGISFALGQMVAQQVLQQELNDALMAARGAIAKTATMNDVSGATSLNKLSRVALMNAQQKFGDAAGAIVCWVGHSKPYGDLLTEAITPAAGASDILTQVAIFGASAPTLGKPMLVTDSASLVLDVTTDKYFTLGLTQGAIRLKLDTQLAGFTLQRVLGKANIINRLQGERDWFVSVKGYTWDYANGGANPDDTALLLSTNWDLAATSIKHSAGVCVKSL